MPISIHITSLIQVSAGKNNIMPTQQRRPAAGIQGTSGVLNPRGALGCVRRTTITPKQTNEKANNVPILVISPAMLGGTVPANTPIIIIKRKLLRAGVWKRLCKCENIGGSKPSLLIL